LANPFIRLRTCKSDPNIWVYLHVASLGHFGDLSLALVEPLKVRKYKRVRLKVIKLRVTTKMI
nr:hypothetical protein [Tanacetum cinerariifolium]